MLRIREIEKQSPVQIIIFSPIFTLCEQYIQILSTTLQTVGITGGCSVGQILFHAQYRGRSSCGDDTCEHHCGNIWLHVLFGPFS